MTKCYKRILSPLLIDKWQIAKIDKWQIATKEYFTTTSR